MTVQAFMTSGILEKYALGMASEEEKHEVLEMASQHLEIKEELSAIRQTLKGYVLSHQVAPPENLKEKVMSAGDRKVAAPTKKEASASNSTSYQPSPSRKKEAQGISMASIAAALLGLALVAACFTAYTFFSDVEKAKTDLAAANGEMENVRKQLATEQETNKELQSKLAFYQDRDNQLILLRGTSRSPNSKATIFWNETTRSASIDLPALPNLTNGKVAVIWANADGNTQKLGILKPNGPGELTQLTFPDKYNTFFVTEEDNPDVEKPNRAKVLMSGG